MGENRLDFLDFLRDRQLVSDEMHRDLQEKFPGGRFAALMHLVGLHPDWRNTLGRIWADSLGYAYVEISRTVLQYELSSDLPEDFARSRHVLPLYEFGGAITLATPTPQDPALIAEVESYLNTFVSPVFGFPDEIDGALEVAFQSDSELVKAIEALPTVAESAQTPLTTEDLEALGTESSVVAFTDGLIRLAVRKRASDIHIEPAKDHVRIRVRIDGMLQPLFVLERGLIGPLVCRFKILAQQDIANTRTPQDGRIQTTCGGRAMMIRFASAPTIYGEKVVLRLSGQRAFHDVPNMGDLDFSGPITAELAKIQNAPNGLFLVTGPTGSGKTTTLYGLLGSINHPGVNIITIENPVEYALQGVNHIEISETVGLTFASVMRAILRQDPDVILLGEVRDSETATVACRAALTGHLVLTTMHTNTSLQSITRLLDLGVDPSLVSPSLLGVMAQRLVRRLCPMCRQSHNLSEEEIRQHFKWDGRTPVTFYRPSGCTACGNVGYRGRLAIHETFVLDDAMRVLVSRQAPLPEIVAHARSKGFMPVRYDGLKKVLCGLTSAEEIDRVAPGW